MKKALLFSLASLFWLVAADGRADNWSHWRGPEQTGVSWDTDLPDRWSPDPAAPDNNLIWKSPYGGRTTPIIQNGRVASPAPPD